MEAGSACEERPESAYRVGGGLGEQVVVVGHGVVGVGVEVRHPHELVPQDGVARGANVGVGTAVRRRRQQPVRNAPHVH